MRTTEVSACITLHRLLPPLWNAQELFARIDAVTPETIKQVANRFLYDGEIAISALGETYWMQEYMYFRSRTYWLRY